MALYVLVATFVFKETLATTSAVGALVLGFALQDTLGNAFAGLAIQMEKPFRVGHWIAVGDFVGRVTEITWRATKLRTKTGNIIVLPNNILSKEAITNYSEPESPTRLEVVVGASYLLAPNTVKAAILEAMKNCPRVLKQPAADVVLSDFSDSAISYKVRFWVSDYERDELARDEGARRSITRSIGTRSRSHGRSRSSTSERSRLTKIPPSGSSADRGCWRTSICSRRCRTPSASGSPCWLANASSATATASSGREIPGRRSS